VVAATAIVISIGFLVLSEPESGVSGILSTVIFAAILFMGAVILPIVQVEPADAGQRANVRLVVAVIILFIGVALTWIATSQSVEFAKLDAQKALIEAPQATIRFTSLGGHEFLHSGSEDGEGKSTSPYFRVILIGEKFVYLQPIVPGVQPDQLPIHGVPAQGIASITHISKGSGQ
jgi:hypothetical protein